ncbi:MAG: Asp-tRNA(Asn)/Glu-tRNA(Gln) amidotransferase subunit GatA [bacterium]
MDIKNLAVNDLKNMISKKKASSEEITKAYISQIKKQNDSVKAFLDIFEEAAVTKAKEVDKRISENKKVGDLAGIPIAVKDNICIRGFKTTCASKILENYTAPYNASVIDKLNEADAVILGKTNMDEFAMGSSTEHSAYFTTINPWNKDCIPGGSSGGSAASVSASLAPIAIGSDTGGSIRQPASLCGVVGMKPTYGRVSRYGLVAFASSLDQIGPFSYNIEDTALLLKVISGYDKKDSTSINNEVEDYPANLDKINLKNLKIGLPKEYFIEGLDKEVADAVQQSIKVLEGLGAQFKEISLPHTEYATAVYYIIAPSEASSNLARYDGVKYGFRSQDSQDLLEMYEKTRAQGFGDEVKRRIMLGTYALSSGYYEAYYGKAQKVRTLIKQDFDEAFKEVDCILTPTSPTPAFKIGEKKSDPLQMYLSDVFTISGNLAGIPGISIPCGFSKSGLPIGLQLLGKAFDEQKLLQVGFKYQQSTEFHKQRPK